MTTRERINAYRNELLQGNAFAPRLAEILVELSALSGNVAEEIIECEQAYGIIYNETLNLPDTTVAKAKVRMMITPEYLALQRAKATGESVNQMISSLKYLIRVKENEERNARTQ